MSNYKEKLAHITTFVFDYDGVFTDGVVYLLDNGEQLRTANARDGYALQLALKNGYRICIITGGYSIGVEERFKRLNIEDVYLGAFDKLTAFKTFCDKHNLSKEEILVMGDDIPDLPLIHQAMVSCCPADAAMEVLSAVDYISHYNGGKGCVRDILEQVMRLQGKWLQKDAFYW